MLNKADIRVLKDDGSIDGDPIKVMFNPQKYEVTAEGVIPENKSGSSIEFNTVKVHDFVVDLVFYTYEKEGSDADKDVRKEIDKIASLVIPKVEGKETKRPPVCLFSWGEFIYKGIVFKVKQEFIMFLPSGIPVRANVQVSFKSVITKEEDTLFRGKNACRKLWTVKAGDRLDIIAYQALKDINEWRKIAEVNKIANPLTFPEAADIGKRIILPDIV